MNLHLFSKTFIRLDFREFRMIWDELFTPKDPALFGMTRMLFGFLMTLDCFVEVKRALFITLLSLNLLARASLCRSKMERPRLPISAFQWFETDGRECDDYSSVHSSTRSLLNIHWFSREAHRYLL